MLPICEETLFWLSEELAEKLMRSFCNMSQILSDNSGEQRGSILVRYLPNQYLTNLRDEMKNKMKSHAEVKPLLNQR